MHPSVVLVLHWSFVYLTVENVLFLNENLVCLDSEASHHTWDSSDGPAQQLPLPLLHFIISQQNTWNYRTPGLNEIYHRRCVIRVVPLLSHLFIFSFSPLMMPHFLETSKCYNEEVCEHKLNKKAAGSPPRALPLGDESNASLSRSV